MTLKNVCNALSCKLFSMDIILLIVEPIIILQPLCALVENWQNQEDQSKCYMSIRFLNGLLTTL